MSDPLRIVMLRERVGPMPRPDELDTLAQVAAVGRALANRSHRVQELEAPSGPEWKPLLALQLESLAPHFVWNLVESVQGKSELAHEAPALMEQLGIRFTGSGAESLRDTTDKLRCKKRLNAAGLPTPAWVSGKGDQIEYCRGRWIIKSVCEPGSFGLGADAVVSIADAAELRAIMAERRGRIGECFAEAFIPGREWNISLVDSGGGPMCLPPAEMVFLVNSLGGESIVDYRAKWDPEADAEIARRYTCVPDDEALVRRMRSLAASCWDIFGLQGYARVDFRVDTAGEPWIIDVNANPCIAPDAGLAAAALQAGMKYDELVCAISRAALPLTLGARL